MRRSSRLLALLVVGLTACTAAPSGTVATSTTAAPSAGSSVTSPATSVPARPPLRGIDAPDGLGDSYYPDLGNAGYDIAHVDLALRVDPETLELFGRSTLTAEATEDLDSFSLDFDLDGVEAVTVDGRPAAFTLDGGELRIDPEPVLPAGSEFVVTVEYSGSAQPFPSQGAPFATGLRKGVDSVFAFSEPDGTSSWMPINDHPLDKATYRLAVTVQNPYVVASIGTLVSTELLDEDTTTYVWETVHPVASYLVPLGVGDLVRTDEVGPDGIPIRNYFDDDLPDASLGVFDRQGEMLAFLQEIFGPYPFEAYGSLVIDTVNLGAALETQTLSTYGRQSLAAGEAVVIHELAHQWFGNSVSVADWSDIWLNEGFATYTQWLWLERQGRVDEFESEVSFAYDVMSGSFFLDRTGDPDAARAEAQLSFPPPGSPEPDDLFNASVYFRGGLLLHALRLEIGDEAFFAALREYAARFAYGNATTDDFVSVVEDVTGRDWDAFFEAWLLDREIPPIPEMGLEPPR